MNNWAFLGYQMQKSFAEFSLGVWSGIKKVICLEQIKRNVFLVYSFFVLNEGKAVLMRCIHWGKYFNSI